MRLRESLTTHLNQGTARGSDSAISHSWHITARCPQILRDQKVYGIASSCLLSVIKRLYMSGRFATYKTPPNLRITPGWFSTLVPVYRAVFPRHIRPCSFEPLEHECPIVSRDDPQRISWRPIHAIRWTYVLCLPSFCTVDWTFLSGLQCHHHIRSQYV